jgi:hypothetical protein
MELYNLSDKHSDKEHSPLNKGNLSRSRIESRLSLQPMRLKA